jgi:dihydropteroate synthase
MDNQDDTKYYLQPLGFLRGCCGSDENFIRLAGTDLYFSALKIISRTDRKKISQEIVAIDKLPSYLKKLSSHHAQMIKAILQNIKQIRPPLQMNDSWKFDWQKPLIQGVLNMTPDSFSDGGEFNDLEKSILHARQMINAGASIIDIGGESTRPNAEKISTPLEISRVLPVIVALQEDQIPSSVDVVAQSGLAVVLMHAQGDPQTMQENPQYDNVVLDIYDYLQSRIEFCLSRGITKDKIIIDPGIGFGKSVDHNLQILNALSLFHGLGVPLLIGVSRKSFIGKITDQDIPATRIQGSIAAAQICIDQGAQIIRVHDVEETQQALSVWQAIVEKVDFF